MCEKKFTLSCGAALNNWKGKAGSNSPDTGDTRCFSFNTYEKKLENLQDLETLHRVMQKHDLPKGQTRGLLGLKLLVAEIQLAKQARIDIEQHNGKFLKTILLSTKGTTPS